MILYILEMLVHHFNQENLQMYAGFVKVGISRCLGLLFHSRDKMVKIWCLFTLIFNNMSQDSLILHKSK